LSFLRSNIFDSWFSIHTLKKFLLASNFHEDPDPEFLHDLLDGFSTNVLKRLKRFNKLKRKFKRDLSLLEEDGIIPRIKDRKIVRKKGFTKFFKRFRKLVIKRHAVIEKKLEILHNQEILDNIGKARLNKRKISMDALADSKRKELKLALQENLKRLNKEKDIPKDILKSQNSIYKRFLGKFDEELVIERGKIKSRIKELVKELKELEKPRKRKKRHRRRLHFFKKFMVEIRKLKTKVML